MDNIVYPRIPNEIMTGSLGENTYITPMTTGILKDMGYTIDDSSNYIVTTGNNLGLVYSEPEP